MCMRESNSSVHLVEVSGSELPGLGCKVDVVAVMHLR